MDRAGILQLKKKKTQRFSTYSKFYPTADAATGTQVVQASPKTRAEEHLKTA